MHNLEWKNNFTKKALKDGRAYIDTIKEVTLRDKEISASLKKSSQFNVSISIKDDEIEFMWCSCRSKSNCKHQAAVLYYVEENDLIEKEQDFLNIVDSLDEDTLKEYFTDLLQDNPDFKKEFYRKFKKEPRIDAGRYFDKLDSIIESAKGNDYYHFGYYDVDVLAGGLKVFMDYEIDDLMEMHQYEVVFELLHIMAEALNDEMYADNFSWYDACERFLEISYVLEETYVLSEEQKETLYDDYSFMQGFI